MKILEVNTGHFVSRAMDVMVEAYVHRVDLDLRAACGEPGAIMELAYIEAMNEDRQRTRAAEKAACKAFRATRRRWREAYQSAKWGE